MTRTLLRRLRRDDRGATIIEFAMVAPVMLLLMMGLGDLLFQVYAQAVLTGAVQKAARDSGIQASDSSAIDTAVITAITPLIKDLAANCAANPAAGSWCSTRKSYDTFGQVPPEPLFDTNGNNVRDPGECFIDQNGNGVWDADRGVTGQGGASAVALYTMKITYRRMFPAAPLFGWSTTQTISSSLVLKNQPYASQAAAGTTTNNKICT